MCYDIYKIFYYHLYRDLCDKLLFRHFFYKRFFYFVLINCYHTFDMLLNYSHNQQIWRKRRLYHIRLWFIPGVWLWHLRNELIQSMIITLEHNLILVSSSAFSLIILFLHFRLRWFWYGGRTWKCRTSGYETSWSFWEG